MGMSGPPGTHFFVGRPAAPEPTSEEDETSSGVELLRNHHLHHQHRRHTHHAPAAPPAPV